MSYFTDIKFVEHMGIPEWDSKRLPPEFESRACLHYESIHGITKMLHLRIRCVVFENYDMLIEYTHKT